MATVGGLNQKSCVGLGRLIVGVKSTVSDNQRLIVVAFVF